MRTIKLKAYLKAHNETVLVDNIDFIEKEITVIDEYGRDYYFPFDEIILLQYTGLKDKHGKEIFEGDIVEAWSQGVKGTFEVLWRQEGLPCFILYPAYQKGEMWKLHGSKHENGIYYDKGVEVIGNKFEHPELLEQPNAN